MTAAGGVLLVAEQLRRAVPGGIGTYLRGLARGLSEVDPSSRPPVTAFASRPPAPGPGPVSRVARGFGRSTRPPRPVGPTAPDAVAALGFPVMSSPWPGPALTRMWERGRAPAPRGFDLVHSASLAFPPRTPGQPLAVTVHDLVFRETPDAFPPRGRAWHERALARALATADALVVPSERTAGVLAAAGGRVDRIHVVGEGCDHLPPADSEGAARLLAAHGVTGPYLLSVGTLEPRKNLTRLVEAYRRARPRLPDPWPLVVVGPAGWGDGGPPPTSGAVPVGFVSDAVLAGLYAGARALAYVPLAEGFGLPAVEAMASACPVVASPMPSIGEAALVVDPTDVGAIAEALVAAASDDRVRAGLVTAGLVRAGELTWRASAEAHLAVWRTLL